MNTFVFKEGDLELTLISLLFNLYLNVKNMKTDYQNFFLKFLRDEIDYPDQEIDDFISSGRVRQVDKNI